MSFKMENANKKAHNYIKNDHINSLNYFIYYDESE